MKLVCGIDVLTIEYDQRDLYVMVLGVRTGRNDVRGLFYLSYLAADGPFAAEVTWHAFYLPRFRNYFRKARNWFREHWFTAERNDWW